MWKPAVILAMVGLMAASEQAYSLASDEPTATSALDWIKVSEDGTHFVSQKTDQPLVFWGFNYDHDDTGRLLDDYWRQEWPTVIEDFQEMKDLGANVVRIHLQLPRFMETTEQPNKEALEQLAELVRLAEGTGLYLDITGLGCYHKQDVPAWYDELAEADRWDVQARFWRAVASVCKDSPAVFCYDLMNEPVLTGGKGDGWLVGEPLGGKYFVQRITRDMAGRTNHEVAKAWVEKLTGAIREVDPRHLITVGVIPWALVFKGAKPLFHDPEVGKSLDFVSVHFYPKKDQLEETLEALKVYEVGKPLVIEEIFPLQAGMEQTSQFIEKSKSHVDGWISFYWGKTIEENQKAGDIKGAIVAEWLKAFREMMAKDKSQQK